MKEWYTFWKKKSLLTGTSRLRIEATPTQCHTADDLACTLTQPHTADPITTDLIKFIHLIAIHERSVHSILYASIYITILIHIDATVYTTSSATIYLTIPNHATIHTSGSTNIYFWTHTISYTIKQSSTNHNPCTFHIIRSFKSQGKNRSPTWAWRISWSWGQSQYDSPLPTYYQNQLTYQYKKKHHQDLLNDKYSFNHLLNHSHNRHHIIILDAERLPSDPIKMRWKKEKCAQLQSIKRRWNNDGFLCLEYIFCTLSC